MGIDLAKSAKVDALPPSTTTGGRKSQKPELRAWLEALEFGTYILASTDEDNAHPTGRAASIRDLVKEMNAEADGERLYAIDTRAVVPGKRYQVYATVQPKTPAPKAGAKAK